MQDSGRNIKFTTISVNAISLTMIAVVQRGCPRLGSGGKNFGLKCVQGGMLRTMAMVKAIIVQRERGAFM
jgi:hypothetical protein